MLTQIEEKYYRDIANIKDSLKRIADALEMQNKINAATPILKELISRYPDEKILHTDNITLMGGKTTSLTVLKYEEVKSFVKSWVLTSQTTPAKMTDDNNKILSKINLKLEEIKNYISAKPKSADDLVDVSKLTVKQLKEVQGIILENELAKNNLTMTLGRASQAIGMNEFTPSQRNTILGFLKQNKGKHFK